MFFRRKPSRSPVRSPVALAAAAWWTNLLRQPVVSDNGAVGDAVTRDEAMSAINLAAAISRQQRAGLAKLTESMIVNFESALAMCIDGELSRCLPDPTKHDWVYVDMDYHPSILLVEAAREAGFDADTGIFPLNTCMRVEPHRIMLRAGYQQPWVDLPLD